MNRASQQQLLHQTNIGLISIRQSEITYYTNIYLSLGTQSALLGGFSYTVFTMNVSKERYTDQINMIIEDIYWITSALTIAASVHVIVNCMMLQVLGPGLALNGPVGSMTRATTGMRIELRQIVSSFIVMIVFFAISNILSYWVIMDFQSAVACSLSSIAACYYWGYYCERVYLRFYWDPRNEAAWKATDEDEYGADEMYHNPVLLNQQAAAMTIQNEQKDAAMKDRSRVISKDSNAAGGRSTVKKWLQRLVKRKKKDKTKLKGSGSFSEKSKRSLSGDALDGNSISGRLIQQQIRAAIAAENDSPTRKGVLVEGYLTRRTGGRGQQALRTSRSTHRAGIIIGFRGDSRDNWVRCYATLNSRGSIFFYRTRSDFREDAEATRLNERAIDVADFRIDIVNTLSAVGDLDCTTEEFFGAMGSSKTKAQLRFQITLINRDDYSAFHQDHPMKSTTNSVIMSSGSNSNSNDSKGLQSVSNQHPTVEQSSHSRERNGSGGSGGGVGDVGRNPGRACSGSNSGADDDMSSEGGKSQSARSSRPKFLRKYELRFDTEEELNMWVSGLQTVSPKSFH